MILLMRYLVIMAVAALILVCMCLAMVAAATISGAISYGVGFYGLTQYAEGTNEYIEDLSKSCERKPEMRRGKSHNKPEWTGY